MEYMIEMLIEFIKELFMSSSYDDDIEYPINDEIKFEDLD